MKNVQNFLDLHITLPENFDKKLEEVMDEEFTTACQKWGLGLNYEDRKIVLYHALKQLEGKVSLSGHNKWTHTSQELVFSVKKSAGERTRIDLPSDEVKGSNLKIVRDNTDWKVDQDPNSSAVLLEDFYEYFIDLMITWVRTAVFYGVGSYTQ